uniref:C2 domain-containing protein n=1 Tax=Cajanus cajan TaxID=3821 RepID=A0A151UCM0_CAJCA|nr:hypothetical protein KK1_021290 [Cajanus cajan]
MDRSQVAEKVYVVVRAESLNCCTTKMVNEDAGLLAWNEKFLLDIPSRARSITFEVQCKKFKAVRPVGVARIAVSDFLAVSENSMYVFSYRLRDWEGKINGVIHFAVRVPPPPDSSNAAVEPVMGINVPDNVSNDVVIDIPF